MPVRDVLVILNFAAILVVAGVIAFRVVNVRRNPEHKAPQNLTPFADDNTLETTRLERVLRWSLICAGILAVGLPLYWLREPTRQREEESGFEHRAEERGAVLFAAPDTEHYDSARSLACATCHGSEGVGGAAPFTLAAELTGTGSPALVSWTAPPLNTVLSRFSEEQVTQIITFGRPGTPMAAWGIDGGGPKGSQAVSDLVAYLGSIQLDRDGARGQITDDVAALGKSAAGDAADAELALAAAREDLATAQDELVAVTTFDEREDAALALAAAEQDIAAAEQAVSDAEVAVANAEQALTNSRARAATVAAAGEGELLFDANCARCHTMGWSYFDPLDARIPLPGPAGGGAFGPSLRAGATLEQFPGELGIEQQIEWVTTGAEANQPYGVRGISSGRMPHFGTVLSAEQIQAIVNYERGL